MSTKLRGFLRAVAAIRFDCECMFNSEQTQLGGLPTIVRFQSMPSKNGRAGAHSTSLNDVFDRASSSTTRIRFDAHKAIYAPGDADDAMYLIDSGQVKLSMSSAAGKDCLLAIYKAGEIFGESCFSSPSKRLESAAAMQPTVVRRISRRDFLAEVQKASATESLLRHMATRLADRQTAVFDLVTMDAERRLAKVLLEFGEKLGTADGPFLRVQQRISHEELSQFVGTTRPRVTAFMQRFRSLGMVEDSGHRVISLHRAKLREFLARD